MQSHYNTLVLISDYFNYILYEDDIMSQYPYFSLR